MAVSDDFTKLKEQVEGADQRIRASATQGGDELKAMVEAARTKADARADELSTRAEEAGDTAEAHWNQVQSDWDRHIKQIRKRIDAKKAEHDADWQSAMPSGPRPTLRRCPVRSGSDRGGRVRGTRRCTGQERRGRHGGRHLAAEA